MNKKIKQAAYSYWDKTLVYERPSEDSDIIDVIFKKEIFYILDGIAKKDNYEWIRVETESKYVGYINGDVRYKVINERVNYEETFIIKKVLVYFFILASAVIYSNTPSKLTFIKRITEAINSEIYLILMVISFYFLYKLTLKIERKRRLKKISRIKRKSQS